MIGGPNRGQMISQPHAIPPQQTSHRHKRTKTVEPCVRHSGCKSWEELGTRPIDLPAILARRSGEGGQAPAEGTRQGNNGSALKGSSLAPTHTQKQTSAATGFCRPKPPEKPQGAAPAAMEERSPGPGGADASSAPQLREDPNPAPPPASSSVGNAAASPGAVPSPDAQEAVPPSCDQRGLARSTSTGPEEPHAGGPSAAAVESTEPSGAKEGTAAAAAVPPAAAPAAAEDMDEDEAERGHAAEEPEAGAQAAASTAAPQAAVPSGAEPPPGDGSAAAAAEATAGGETAAQAPDGSRGEGGTDMTGFGGTSEMSAAQTQERIGVSSPLTEGAEATGAHQGIHGQGQGQAGGQGGPQGAAPAAASPSFSQQQPPPGPGACNYIDMTLSPFELRLVKTLRNQHAYAKVLKEAGVLHEAAKPLKRKFDEEQQQQQQWRRHQQQAQRQAEEFAAAQQRHQQQLQDQQEIRQRQQLQEEQQQPKTLQHQHEFGVRLLNSLQTLERRATDRQAHLLIHKHVNDITERVEKLVALSTHAQVIRDADSRAKLINSMGVLWKLLKGWDKVLGQLVQEAKPLSTGRPVHLDAYLGFLQKSSLRLQTKAWVPLRTAQLKLENLTKEASAAAVGAATQRQGSQSLQQRQQSNGRRLQQAFTSTGPVVQSGQAAASASMSFMGAPQESLGSCIPAHLENQFQEWQQQQQLQEQQGQQEFALWQQRQQELQQQGRQEYDLLKQRQEQQRNRRFQEFLEWKQRQQQASQEQASQQQPDVVDLTADDIMPAASQPQVFFQPHAGQPQSSGGPATPSLNPGLVQRQTSGFSLQQLPASLQQPIQEAQHHLAGMGTGVAAPSASFAHNRMWRSASMPQPQPHSQVTGMVVMHHSLPDQQQQLLSSMPLQQAQQPNQHATVAYVASPCPQEQEQHAPVAYVGTHMAPQQQQQHVVLQPVHVPQQQHAVPQPVTVQHHMLQQQHAVPQPVTVQHQMLQQQQQQQQGSSHQTQLPAAVPVHVTSGASGQPSTQQQLQHQLLPGQTTVTTSGSPARIHQPTPEAATATNPAAGSALQAAVPSKAASLQPLNSEPSPSSRPVQAGSGDSSSSVGGTRGSAGQLTWLISQMHGIVKIAMEHDSAFVDPVTDEIAPDYSKYISQPICLKDISRKLSNGDYLKLGNPKDVLRAFRDDLKLMINNCLKYNPPDNQYHKKGIDMWNLLKHPLKVMSFGVQASGEHNDDH